MSLVRELLLNFPAAGPPPGVKPNFIDPPNSRALGLGVQITCIALTTLGVLSRICVKIFVMKEVCLEDYLILIAYV